MSPKGYFLIFIAFHLAVVSHLAAVPLNGPSNPVIPPASCKLEPVIFQTLAFHLGFFFFFLF